MRKSSFACLLSLVTTAGIAKERPYESLLIIQEDISIANVEASIVPSIGLNPTVVQLEIKGMSACGEEMLATHVDNVLRFHQVGRPGVYRQPGCVENIQYLWTPGHGEMAEGQPTIVELSIPAAIPGGEKSGFEVSVRVVKKIGELPSGNVGIYFEYSQLKIAKF